MKEDKSQNSDRKLAFSRRIIGGDAPMVINEITDNCLFSSFYGTIDSVRMKKVIDSLLEVVSRNENDIIIIDLSNIDIIDSSIAAHLTNLNKLLKLVGMEVVFCGIKPVVAQSMITAGVEMENLNIQKHLKSAINWVYDRQGFKLVKK